MTTRYAVAPEFASQPKIPIPANRWVLRLFDFAIRMQRRRFRFGDDVAVRTHSVGSSGGATIPVLEIAPHGLAGDAPALVDYHGGGFFFSHTPLHLDIAARYAVEARCRVFFPDYRLSIDHPFPAAFDDCYATLGWVHARAAELGVDPARVALVGDSAGGALAAGVAQKALDRGEHPIRGQILIYPVTDHETRTESARAFTDTPLWKTSSNLAMWKVYLRDTEFGRSGGAAPVPDYAAPLHRSSFAGLPPAWIELAEFDPLRDEGRAYAEALAAAGVAVDVREVAGGIHGYDVVSRSPTADAIRKERMQAIERFLHGS